MSFADTAGTDKDAVGLVANEVEGHSARNEIAVDRVWVIEVVGIHGGQWEDCGALQGGSGAGFKLDAELFAHEVVEQPDGRFVAGNGFLRGRVQFAGSVVEV